MKPKKALEPQKKVKKPEKKITRRKERVKGGRNTVKTDLNQCTEKERVFLDALFDPACEFLAWKAYKKAYPNSAYTTAKSNGYTTYRRLLPIIQSWLDEAGLSKEHLKHKLLTLLSAMETKFFPYMKKVTKTEMVDGKLVRTKEEFQEITRVDVVALAIQIKALELGMKSHGMLSEKSTREVDQIDELIELELAKLAAAGQAPTPAKAEKKNKPAKATA